jgi:hypothetical protein
VWLGGSAAMGAYEQGRSDVDVAAAALGPLDSTLRDAVVAAVRHEALPCPARKLELVVHRGDALARGRPGVQLNLETGPGETAMPAVEEFWFVIDLSILRAHGRALAGPAPGELVAEPDRGAVLRALREALHWHVRAGAPPDDVVLNACRTLLFLREGRWASKRDAAGWAVAEGVVAAPLARGALALRSGEAAAGPDPDAAAAFAREAYRLVADRSASSSPGLRNS